MTLDELDAAIAEAQENLAQLKFKRQYQRRLGDAVCDALEKRRTNPQGVFTVIPVDNDFEIQVRGFPRP